MGEKVPWQGKENVMQDSGVVQGIGTREIDRVQREMAILSNVGIVVLAFAVVLATALYVNSGLVVAWDPEMKSGWGSGRFTMMGFH
jgi:phytoene desaturase (3,4-didehydrolycopene-forming)